MALSINCVQPTGIFVKAVVEGREPCSLKARGIDGEKLQVLGQAELNFLLGNDNFIHSFVVVGIANTCVLGADFLKISKMMVDVGKVILARWQLRTGCRIYNPSCKQVECIIGKLCRCVCQWPK